MLSNLRELKTSFVDVDKNSWSYKAIGALEEKGVTIGTGGNMYSPTSVVTREQYSQFYLILLM